MLVILGSIAGVFVIGAVGATSRPNAPTITSGPTGNVNTSSATFKYSTSTSGVTYLCSLDNGSYKSCPTTGVTYSHLSNGSHVFRVEAKKNNATSSETTRTWTIDTSGPTIWGTFPRNLHTYGTDSWNDGCASGPGICGTASDPSGVASVRVGVLSLSKFKYWNGSSFSSGGQFLLSASGTTHWRLPMPVPPSGFYAVFVSATDSLGNVRSVAKILVFTTDTHAPPTPIITHKPAASTALTSATFKFTDSKWGVHFKCSLDGAVATWCTSPKSYSGLAAGGHTFSVVAVDNLGNTSAPATYHWTITSAAPSAPPAPSITDKPAASTTDPNATLTFTDTQSPVTFKCSFDSSAFAPCTSPAVHSNLDVTGHCFSVVAVDTLGQSSPATQYCWTITSLHFTITGAPAGTFAPDVTQYANLSITNPNNFAIKITAIAVTVADATTKASLPNPGCVGSTNLVVSQNFSGTVTVPANSTVAVPQAQSPKLTMPNLSVNQDACKGTTFSLSYSGTATL